MKVGIIGGGWAGVVCARMFFSARHEVELWHDQPALGGMLGVGSLYGVPIDMGPHVFHGRNLRAWEWASQFCCFVDFKKYPCRTVLRDGRAVGFPPSMEDADVLDFDPIDLGRPAKTLMEMILQRYGQQTWDLVYRDYTERLWGRDDIGLWSFVSEEPGRIPKTSEYLTANSRVAYPCNGWRHVVEHIWPFAWKHGRVDVEHVDADVIIDTSPKLYGGAWRQASFSAQAEPALPCIVEYQAERPNLLRTINQSRIAGCYMPDQLSINVSQYSTIDHDGSLYATACHTSNAYPMPGLDAEIENVWQSLPDNVWPFGRGGLHVYDSMANVVSGAMRLVDMIKGQEHGPTIEELHELRAIVGGWQ